MVGELSSALLTLQSTHHDLYRYSLTACRRLSALATSLSLTCSRLSFVIYTKKEGNGTESSCWFNGHECIAIGLECQRSRVQDTVILLSMFYLTFGMFFYLVSSFRVNFGLV